MKKPEKVLIIKLGYSEILDKDDSSRKVSLGDVLRTTPLLHLYKNEEVTWLTDEKAFPLLHNNSHIKRILPYDLTTILQLESEEFDTVINLEKIPGICALSDKIKAWKKYGFRFDARSGRAEAHDKAFETLSVSSNTSMKKKNLKTVQEILFRTVGKKWKGEDYILGYKPITEEKYDVGLNTQVGEKWPTKAWPTKHWDELERLLINDGINVTRQDKEADKGILQNIERYMDWLNSCKIIVTNDSLGLHLGIAMKKKVLGLFGATPSKEIYFYNRGKAILPEPIPECIPCFEGKCERKKNCIEDISPDKVYKEINSVYN
jgi:heptosyltransferase-2